MGSQGQPSRGSQVCMGDGRISGRWEGAPAEGTPRAPAQGDRKGRQGELRGAPNIGVKGTGENTEGEAFRRAAGSQTESCDVLKPLLVRPNLPSLSSRCVPEIAPRASQPLPRGLADSSHNPPDALPGCAPANPFATSLPTYSAPKTSVICLPWPDIPPRGEVQGHVLSC